MRGLGLGFGLRRANETIGSPTAIVAQWKARVVALGGSMDAATEAAARTLVAALQQAGAWSHLIRLNLHAGDQLTAALVPLMASTGYPVDVGVNLVSGDYAPATGLQGAWGLKYCNTGLYIPSAISGVMFNALVAFTIINGTALGVNDGTRHWTFSRNPGDGYTPRVVLGGSTSYYVEKRYVATIPGVHYARRSSATNLKLFKDGVETNARTDELADLAGISKPLYIMALNNNGVLASNCPGALSGYWVDDGAIPDAAQPAINAAVRAFTIAIGRAYA